MGACSTDNHRVTRPTNQAFILEIMMAATDGESLERPQRDIATANVDRLLDRRVDIAGIIRQMNGEDGVMKILNLQLFLEMQY